MRKSRDKSSKKTSIQSYHKVSLIFVGASLLLLIFVLYLSVSKAIIDITPKERVVTVEVPASIVGEVDEENEIPGLVFDANATQSRTFSLSQEDAQPVEGNATGTVTIYNESDRSQPLIATTRFLSESGVLFRLDEGVTVEGNSSVIAKVTADEEGAIGDIAPTRFTIPGLNETRQQEIYAESENEMTGGVRYVRPLRESDIEGATEELKKQITKELEEQWTETYDAKGFNKLFTSTEVLNIQADAEVGEEIGVFTVTMSARVQGVAYANEAMEQILSAQISNTLNQGEELSRVNYEAVNIEITNIDTDDGVASMILSLDGSAVISETHPSVTVDQFVNLSEKEVEDQLKGNELIEDADVRFIPAWLKRMPTLPDHIEVRIKVKN